QSPRVPRARARPAAVPRTVRARPRAPIARVGLRMRRRVVGRPMSRRTAVGAGVLGAALASCASEPAVAPAPAFDELRERWRHLGLVDTHSHAASGRLTDARFAEWD